MYKDVAQGIFEIIKKKKKVNLLNKELHEVFWDVVLS